VGGGMGCDSLLSIRKPDHIIPLGIGKKITAKKEQNTPQKILMTEMLVLTQLKTQPTFFLY